MGTNTVYFCPFNLCAVVERNLPQHTGNPHHHDDSLLFACCTGDESCRVTVDHGCPNKHGHQASNPGSDNEQTKQEGNPVAALLDAAVQATAPTKRHALFDALAGAVGRNMETLPDDRVCACGRLLEDEYSLDFSTGWQDVHFSDGTWHGTTEGNDQETVADIMCQSCKRLYQLPDGSAIHWT